MRKISQAEIQQEEAIIEGFMSKVDPSSQKVVIDEFQGSLFRNSGARSEELGRAKKTQLSIKELELNKDGRGITLRFDGDTKRTNLKSGLASASVSGSTLTVVLEGTHPTNIAYPNAKKSEIRFRIVSK